MDGKGFFHSTAVLITTIAALLGALVGLGIFLFGEGVLLPPFISGGNKSAHVEGEIQRERTFGRLDTGGFELDDPANIERNPDSDPDLLIFESINQINASSGAVIVAWEQEKQPGRQECDDLLETHGITGGYKMARDSRFCVRSSEGRIAFLAVVSSGDEFYVAVWPKA